MRGLQRMGGGQAVLVAAVTLLINPIISGAASVTFSTGALAGLSDVSVSGALVESGNVGNGLSLTFSGVHFDADGALFGLAADNVYNAAAMNSPGLNYMLKTLAYGSGSKSVTFTDLTIGTAYEVQFFFVQNVATRTVTVADGVGGSIATAAVGTPQRVTGTFTADADTQTFTFTGSDGWVILNGYQLRDRAAPDAGLQPMPISYALSSVAGPADLLAAGSLVSAHNVAGANLTVAGILFAATGNILGSGGAIFNPNNATGDTGLDALLHSGSYVGAGYGPWPVRIAGLTKGKLYAVQFLVVDNRYISARTVKLRNDSGNSLASSAIPTPQSLVATFTAEDDHAVFDLPISLSGVYQTSYLSAYQVRQIPVTTGTLLSIR